MCCVCPCLQAAVRGLMSREHQMLTWHTISGDLEAKQKALAEMDKSKVWGISRMSGQRHSTVLLASGIS